MAVLEGGGVSHERGTPTLTNTNKRRVRILQYGGEFFHLLQGYLAHRKPTPPLEPPFVLRHGPTVGSYRGTSLTRNTNPLRITIGPQA